MKDNFQSSLASVLISEGGYVNNPRDPGGATNYGITQHEYDHWRAEQGLQLRPVKFINTYEISTIYRTDYWGPAHCDELPSGLDYCIFDFGVNASPGRAIRFLQQVSGAKVDGLFGPSTVQFVIHSDTSKLIEDYTTARLAYYKRLPTYDEFGHGWDNRAKAVEQKALSMVRTETVIDEIG